MALYVNESLCVYLPKLRHYPLLPTTQHTAAQTTAELLTGYEPSVWWALTSSHHVDVSSGNIFKQGYVPLNRYPNEYHRWSSLFRSIMYEETGLGEVMSGTEKAPEAPVDGTEEGAVAAFQTKKHAFKQKRQALHAA